MASREQASLRNCSNLAAAPTTLRSRILDLIEAETRRCLEGQHAEIIAKVIALVDPDVIDALYRASRAGVKIQLNVRGRLLFEAGCDGD